MVTVNIDENRVSGTAAILKEYLDNALYDYDHSLGVDISELEDCLYIHKLLSKLSFKDYYEEKFNKIKEIKERNSSIN